MTCFPTAELDSEHAQKVLEMEHTQQVKLKERQKFFEEAFQQDMEQYLSAGYLQIAERRGEGGGCRLAPNAPVPGIRCPSVFGSGRLEAGGGA